MKNATCRTAITDDRWNNRRTGLRPTMPLLEMTNSSLRPSTRSLSVSRTLGLQKSVVLLVGTALFCAAAPRVVPQDWNGSVTSFVIIDNTAGSPINDVFSNLVDNSTFTSNGNTYRVSCEGGTGNV